MQDKNGKKLVFYCACGKMNRWGKWEFVSKNTFAEMQKHKNHQNIKLVESVCETCFANKIKKLAI